MGWGEKAEHALASWGPVVGAATLTGFGGLVGSVGVADGVPDTFADFACAGTGLGMIIGGTWWTGSAANKTRRQRASLQKSSEHLTGRFGLHGPTVVSLLRDLQHSTIGSGNAFRVSLFVPAASGAFELVARYSEHPTHSTAGKRAVYPPHEGLVAKVWSEGETLVKGVRAANRGAWERVMVEQFGFSPENAAGLRMQSRSYLAMLLRPGGSPTADPVGVLVAESTKRDGIEARHVDEFEASLYVQHLVSVCQDTCAVNAALASISS